MIFKLQPLIALTLVAREASALSLGQFNVSLTTSFLTDHTRRDPFSNTSQPRTVAISTFTPATTTCTNLTTVPYMPAALAAFEGSHFATDFGLPATFFANLTLSLASSSCTNNTPSTQPTILFSPALGTSRHFYTLLLASLAAATRAPVVALDHPFDADAVLLPDGTLQPGIDFADAQIPLALATRAQDVRFVLDALDAAAPRTPCGKLLAPSPPPPGAVAVGHSLGGAAAVLAAAGDARFRGAANVDGSVPVADVANVTVAQPALFLAHEGKNRTADPTWEAVWPRLTGWKGLLGVVGSEHYSFSDLPVLFSALGKDVLGSEAVVGFLGTIEGEEALRTVVGVVGAFFEMVVGGTDGEGFKKAVKGFDKVETIE